MEVALKVIRRVSRRTRTLDAIRRETAVLQRVHHVNVISCLEIIDDPGHSKAYLVLELAGIGRLPWRRAGPDHICRHEWERIQTGIELRVTAKIPSSYESLGSQVSNLDTLASASQPPRSLHLAPCESTSTTPFPREGENGSPLTYKPLHFLDAEVNKETIPDQFQYVPCITMEQARRAILDAVSGLECVHAHGIVHRDIKPDNLLWTRDYRVKICDFSTSFLGPAPRGSPLTDVAFVPDGDLTLFDSENEMMRTIGTPGFIAPELCYMRPDVIDLKTLQQVDIWSLGVTLYCLVFARLPFVADDEYQLYRKMAEQDVYIPTQRLRPVTPTVDSPVKFSTSQYRKDSAIEYENLDKELLDLLHRMLTRDPRKRIRLEAIKTHPWLNPISKEHYNLGPPKSELGGEYGRYVPPVYKEEARKISNDYFFASLQSNCITDASMVSAVDATGDRGAGPCQLANEDYTVSWICALTTEYVAAQVFLDQKHASPAYIATYDNNDYTLGHIRKHNIVIAVLLCREYGTMSAASVTSDMLYSSLNIRIGLIVGISGGAPTSKYDIRLGDVVVGVPYSGLGEGYAMVKIDPRGVSQTPGARGVPGQLTADFYDAVEWAVEQKWSDGSAALVGSSYGANTQWEVASLKPKGLKRIVPYATDLDPYREAAFTGGIPTTRYLSDWFERVQKSSPKWPSHLNLLDLMRANPFYSELFFMLNE
ncbi:hypothetical protein NLG97_g1276 [Lecanicillium saksenae]|uniref:Uncharacterized protein n=1 Tax=Lecanicillium saksenae TaxID=468837 RepID=A0ACC1R8A7_9HYPO|nr:hypothetical protein NLG97_g1276 [Lecanicillium saksenae]